MPCPRSGPSYPLPAPPQALMLLPAGSNTMTGGAAMAACSGLRVRGRCRSQTLSCASTAKLEASPTFHLPGILGQAGPPPRRCGGRLGAEKPSALRAGADDGGDKKGSIESLELQRFEFHSYLPG